MEGLLGTLAMKTQLTARLFKPKDKSLSVDFLREHPVTTHPNLYKEIKSGRRVVKDRLVTDAFAVFVAAQLITETSIFGDFKYHDSGIGTTAEAVGDVGLGTPWGGARSVGSQVQGANTKAYKSVATTTYNLAKAITEHGLFNAATGVTLMDRSVFAAINVVDTNQVEFTYELQIASGG